MPRRQNGMAPTWVQRVSLPSVNTYLTFSLLVFITGFYYYFRVLQSLNQELGMQPANGTEAEDESDQSSSPWVATVGRVLSIIVQHRLLFYILMNSSCAIIALGGKLFMASIFGEPLPASEAKLLHKVFCQFVRAKLIFLVFISHRSLVEDILIWTPWLALNLSLVLILELIGVRLTNPFNAIANRGLRRRLLIGNVVVSFAALVMATFAVLIGWHMNIHYAAFMTTDCILLLLQSLHLLFKLLLLISSVTGQRSHATPSVAHHGDLLYELLHDGLTAANYLHMILFSRLAFTYCCLLFVIQVRYYYHKISTKIQQHWQQLEIVNHIAKCYPKASEAELAKDEMCTICWMAMKSARRLPCGHIFHDFCLRRWLEQDSSCAICRKQLSLNIGHNPVHQDAAGGVLFSDEENALQYVLQAFSPHNGITGWWTRLLFETFNNEQVVDYQVGQIAEMFPQYGREVIRAAIREAGSMQLAIDALLVRANSPQPGGIDPLPNPMGAAGGDQNDGYSSEDSEDEETPSTGDASSASETESDRLSIAGLPSTSAQKYQESDDTNAWLGSGRRLALNINRRKYLLSPRGHDIRHMYEKELSRGD